jgi:hypothetical protein
MPLWRSLSIIIVKINDTTGAFNKTRKYARTHNREFVEKDIKDITQIINE